MIGAAGRVPVFAYRRPVDLRKGFEGLSALVRPGARDFLGSAAEGKSRRLADHVKDNDLAFVISEWDLAPRLDMFGSAPSRVHVLGQMLSWKGLQRSPDESKLRKLLFGFRAGAELGFDDLPVQGLAAPVGSFEAFRDWLAEHKSRSPALEVVYMHCRRGARTSASSASTRT